MEPAGGTGGGGGEDAFEFPSRRQVRNAPRSSEQGFTAYVAFYLSLPFRCHELSPATEPNRTERNAQPSHILLLDGCW